MVGVDPKWLEEGQENEEDCTCGVCFMLMEEPTCGCPDGHCLCKACYLMILEGGSRVCPTCREPTDEGKMQRIRPLESIIGKLRVRCTYGEGCSWRGTVADLAAHMGSSCPLAPISCTNPGCEERVARQDMAVHAEGTCRFKRACPHCQSITHECLHGVEPCELPFPGETRSPDLQLPGIVRGLESK